MANRKKKETMENAKKVADKMYDVSDYENKDEASRGLATTHEQVSDVYAEGTVDAQIDDVNKNGELKSHRGDEIRREGYKG